MVDSKLKDVSHVLLSTAKSYLAHGATAITCWADVGKDALTFLTDRLYDKIELVILTALTSLSYEQAELTAKNNILLAVECGCDLIQILGNFPELISWAKQHIPTNVKILSCGIGRQGGRIGDAIKYGASYEIIGRHILNSFDISTSIRECHKLIHNNFSK